MILNSIELLKLYKLDLQYLKNNSNDLGLLKKIIELRKSRTFDIFKKIKNKPLNILIEYVKLRIKNMRHKIKKD